MILRSTLNIIKKKVTSMKAMRKYLHPVLLSHIIIIQEMLVAFYKILLECMNLNAKRKSNFQNIHTSLVFKWRRKGLKLRVRRLGSKTYACWKVTLCCVLHYGCIPFRCTHLKYARIIGL